MKQLLAIISTVVIITSLVVIGYTFRQVQDQRTSLADDLQLRTALLADSFKESIRPSYLTNSTATLQSLLDKFENREQLLGLAVYDSKGVLFATSAELPNDLTNNNNIDTAEKAMAGDDAQGDFAKFTEGNVYVFATPLHQDENVIGALVVYQHADYIDAAIRHTWNNNLLKLLIQALLFSIAVVLILRWIIYRPIIRLAEAIRQARTGKYGHKSPIQSHAFFKPITAEIAKMSQSLFLARTAASEEARMRLEKLDSPWTAERLKEFFKAYLKDRKIFVVSNREPYIHKKIKNEIQAVVPPSGMVTALEPVMEACGGLWLAHGSGDADRLTVDKNDKIQVPPDDPKYTLKRLWLTDKEVKGYYVGFANEALWPLCHLSHTRPIFRKEDWLEYRKVNGKFAQSLLSEIKDVQRPIILIQDYHFALLPEMIKNSRPDAEVGLFWHIPWPNAEIFSICPFRKEILEGILGADVIGFHTQQFCNNFLETVGKEIESVADLEKFAVTHKGHVSNIKPFPISVAFAAEDDNDIPPKSSVLETLGLNPKILGVGIDRLDYTKGLLERFKGLEFFFDSYPAYKGQFTFLQIAPPSREGVEKYRQFNAEVTKEAERINQKFENNSWKPIVLLKENYTHEEIYPLYRAANVCLVTSLSDGMNLVAKEFVSARGDESGVLILSQFTGAARDLKDAIVINPYSAEETAEAIYRALVMPAAEQHRRMKKMREAVKNYNIYRWAAEFLKAITSLV
ncbi:MAG: trehalose-6-phosphate synthase [Candidatus Doudnabacteria bacterium]|nr:trehalose-6-phosphate synthase [Candidatus Doudnabacteria bacterium]